MEEMSQLMAAARSTTPRIATMLRRWPPEHRLGLVGLTEGTDLDEHVALENPGRHNVTLNGLRQACTLSEPQLFDVVPARSSTSSSHLMRDDSTRRLRSYCVASGVLLLQGHERARAGSRSFPQCRCRRPRVSVADVLRS